MFSKSCSSISKYFAKVFTVTTTVFFVYGATEMAYLVLNKDMVFFVVQTILILTLSLL